MTHSQSYGWCVYGVDSDGKGRGIATDDEAEAVALFWELADSHEIGHLAFHAEERTLWLNQSSILVRLWRINLGPALRWVQEGWAQEGDTGE